MAAVGSAVGLGNIWGFPYKMGSNGGFAFLLVYILLAIFVGLAVMLGELALGRKTGQGAVGAYRKMSQKYTWVGYAGVVTGFCILCFYFVLGGIVLRYTCGYFLAMFGSQNFGDTATFFSRFLVNGWSMVIYFAVFVLINIVIVSGGIANGIEKFSKIAMPALFVMLVIVLVYVACQPGAVDGYKFMFGFNVELLKTDLLTVLKTAAGQMFFSLSLGMGCMITYGSYLSKGEDLQKNSVIIVVCDSLIAIMAGMVVMPACFAFGIAPGGGPGLLFASMQTVFTSMGGFIGNLMGFLFYFLVLIAAITSSISILEVCTASVVDKNMAKGKGGKDGGRKLGTIIFAVVIFVFGLPVALDGLGTGLAGNDFGIAALPTPAELFGVTSGAGWAADWLDFYDMISEGILMPLGALVMSLLIGWKWCPNWAHHDRESVLVEEIEQGGAGKKMWGHIFFELCFKFITPVGMIFVLYAQITSFFL